MVGGARPACFPTCRRCGVLTRLWWGEMSFHTYGGRPSALWNFRRVLDLGHEKTVDLRRGTRGLFRTIALGPNRQRRRQGCGQRRQKSRGSNGQRGKEDCERSQKNNEKSGTQICKRCRRHRRQSRRQDEVGRLERERGTTLFFAHGVAAIAQRDLAKVPDVRRLQSSC
jgi:hypothetical protein